MTTLREAAEMALRSMEDAVVHAKFRRAEHYINPDAIKSLREALAQPEPKPEPEPVAWMVYTLDGKSAFVTDNPKDFTQDHRVLPLYTRSNE